MKKRAFISFDYDNDSRLKDFLIGQSKNPDSQFEIFDMSIKEAIATNWKDYALTKIKGSDVVIVICGQKTHTANGVTAELKMAQQLNKPYFLLKGYPDVVCTKPCGATSNDKIYKWTWDNLKALISGNR